MKKSTLSRCNHYLVSRRTATFTVLLAFMCAITLLYGNILSIPKQKVLISNRAKNVTVKVRINNFVEANDAISFQTFTLPHRVVKKMETEKVDNLKYNNDKSDREMNIGHNKNSSLLTKLQDFLSSLPEEEKHTYQFNYIQKHVHKLAAKTVFRQVKNKTTDDIPDPVKPSHLNPKREKTTDYKEEVKEERDNISGTNEENSAKDGRKNVSTTFGEDSAKLVRTEMQYCETEKYLKGRQDLPDTVTVEQVKDPAALGRIRKGGVYQPRDCRPRDSVAIIIPYRDRQKHLEIFINHMHSFLQRQQLQYGIFVVELARPTVFNRGLLANVGFLAAQGTGLYNCYVIHDVDLLPINDKNFYTCSGQFRHLSVANPKFGNGLPYLDYTGGVIAIREDVYVNCNGFSNLYFGWGGEDDDFGYRAKAANYSIERPTQEDGAYIALPHGPDSANPPNPKRFKMVNEGGYRRSHDGINSMCYEQLSLTLLDQYSLVYVRVNKTQVLQNRKTYDFETLAEASVNGALYSLYYHDPWMTLTYFMARSAEVAYPRSQTTVIRHVGDIEIYESDLRTLEPKHAVNDKIINSYFGILQETSNGKVIFMKPTFKYQKKPWFPETLNTSKTELLFLPMRRSRYWTLTIIICKENRITFLDPTSYRSKMETAFIRSEYQNQFDIALSEIEYFSKAITIDKDENNSGILIMMYAKIITEGKSLDFEQSAIDAARVEIEKLLRS